MTVCALLAHGRSNHRRCLTRPASVSLDSGNELNGALNECVRFASSWLQDIAVTVAALRGLRLYLDPGVLRLLKKRVSFLLVGRQRRRQRQADRAQLQRRLKEVAAGVLRRT
eukprot:scaffold230524_cov20-Tisochrysis_lutea.AAC.1